MVHSLWLSFSLFFIPFSLLVASVNGENDGSNAAIIPAVAPPPQSKGGPSRPSIAVIVGVLTTVFSLTFLLLLYAKHCRRGDSLNPFAARAYPPTYDRKNSGIDRAVIDSLPIFRFASLRGQKDGLECAVCLNRFESTEVLRLLPKCKHAFHVECVDTWLDAHSTCPLCRYRVDPEDILLVEDNRILYSGETPTSRSSASQHPTPDLKPAVSRVSGRHSFAGNSLEVIVETPKSAVPRRSLDSWSSRKKKRINNNNGNGSEIAEVGCFDRPRKDELLLAESKTAAAKGKDIAAEQRRLEHRIIISGDLETDGPGPHHHRWSDVQPSDLLFLQAEKILSDSSRGFSGSRALRQSISTRSAGEASTSRISSSSNSRNVVINGRSVSEITGFSRFRSNDDEDVDDGDGAEEEVQVREEDNDDKEKQKQRQRRNRRQRLQEEQRKRQEGVASRWLAWISQSESDLNSHFHRQKQQELQKTAVEQTTTTTTTTPSASSSV